MTKEDKKAATAILKGFLFFAALFSPGIILILCNQNGDIWPIQIAKGVMLWVAFSMIVTLFYKVGKSLE